MRTLTRWAPMLALLMLCGCFQIEDDLTLQADGSGSVKLAVQVSNSEHTSDVFDMSSRFGGRGEPTYPPTNERQARQFFPAGDFDLKVDEKDGEKGKTVSITAAFKDVNALLRSPYGRAHQLSLTTNAGVLQFRGLSGGNVLAQAAQFKEEGEMGAVFAGAGMEELKKQKNEMKFRFRISLPNAVTAGNGAKEGKLVTWSAARADCKDDTEFASKLTGTLEAACPAQGIQFVPNSPPRLGLDPFHQLAGGKVPAARTLPDTNKVLAAAQFVPFSLQVTRSVDLSGEGAGQNSQAQLSGGIIVPEEFLPHSWGQPKLQEALDGSGKSLVPKGEEEEMSFMMDRYSHSMFGGFEEEEGEEGDAGKSAAPKPHMVMLSFKAPEWKVKKISKLRGAIDLHYLGGSEIVKISNAVPASLVMDSSRSSSFSYDGESDRGMLTDPRLIELGLKVQVGMVMVENGMTMLTLQTAGEKASLIDAQVFDTAGQPWPTLLSRQDSGAAETTVQLMVAGKPKPPFSLALQVGAIAASVAIPITVENVPVGDK